MRSQTFFAPFLSRLRPRLGLPNGYMQVASRSWQVAPESRSVAPAAIYDAGELARITGGSPDRTKDEELASIHGGPQRHAPTMAFEFRNAVLAQGHLFTNRMCYPLSAHRLPFVAREIDAEYDEAVLVSSPYGIKYFGHWMRDDLPRVYAARDIGHPVSVLARPTRGQQGYLDLLELNTDVAENAFFKRIVVLEDYGHNPFRLARFLKMREIAARVAPPTAARGVMLLRGAVGERRQLENEVEVAEAVAARGFRVLDSTRATAREMIEACREAPIVLGVEGSQLSNGMMWMSRRGAVLVLQPPQRFVSVHKDYCDLMGIGYAFVVGHATSDGGFRIDLDALLRMIDGLEARYGSVPEPTLPRPRPTARPADAWST